MSAPAIEFLKLVVDQSDGESIFYGQDQSRSLSENTHLCHGFSPTCLPVLESTVDALGTSLSYSQVIEGIQVKAACGRSQRLEERREMMGLRCDYLAQLAG